MKSKISRNRNPFALLAKMRNGGPMRDKRSKRDIENKNNDSYKEEYDSVNILNEAKKIAKQRKLELDQKSLRQEDNYLFLKEELHTMYDQLLTQLRKLDNQPSKYGIFNISKIQYFSDPVLLLCADDKKVAWFKYKIVSGTKDLSDECKNISFTEPRVWARIYKPVCNYDHNGNWDLEQSRLYHNGGWTIYASSNKDMPNFLKNLTEHLADWF